MEVADGCGEHAQPVVAQDPATTASSTHPRWPKAHDMDISTANASQMNTMGTNQEGDLMP